MTLILHLIAVICLLLEAFSVPSARVRLGWLGLALWLLGNLVVGVVPLR